MQIKHKNSKIACNQKVIKLINQIDIKEDIKKKDVYLIHVSNEILKSLIRQT